MPSPLLILGTHLYAPQVLEQVEATGRFEVTGFVENLDRGRLGTAIAGRPVLWLDDVRELAATHAVVCSLGTLKRARFIAEAEALGFRFATIVHPSAVVSPRAELGPGTVVSALAFIGTGVRIGRHVMVYAHAIIGHDCRIGDLVNVGAGVKLAGAVTVGSVTHLGIGAVVLERLSIGDGALVAAGALVTRSVPDRSEVRGVPARIVREGIEPR